MMLYILTGFTICALIWAHVTASDYTISDGAEQYTVDMLPVGALLVGVVLSYYARGAAHTAFGFGVVCLVGVVSCIFAVLWYLVGQHPAAVATAGVFAAATYVAIRLAPRGILGMRIMFSGEKQ